MRQFKITHSVTQRDPILDKYLAEIGKIDLLTQDEEVALAQKIKQGDEKALEKLTKANLRFVVSVAKQYQNQGLTMSDLINEGNLGLMKAAIRFDETKGFKFISYAVRRVRQSIIAAICEQGNVVRRPSGKNKGKIGDHFMQFVQEMGYTPSEEELLVFIQEIGTEVSTLNIKEYFRGRDVSLNMKIGDDEDGEMIDFLIGDDPRENNSLEKITVKTLEQIAGALFPNINNTNIYENNKAIKTKQDHKHELQDILQRFWGVGKYSTNQTIDDIANNYGVSSTSIRQKIEKIGIVMQLSGSNGALKNPELYSILKENGMIR